MIDPNLLIAIVTGVFTFLGTIITVKSGNSKIESELDKHNAVQDEKITELTREVRKHNEFATRIPRIEQRLEDDERRIEKLEQKGA